MPDGRLPVVVGAALHGEDFVLEDSGQPRWPQLGAAEISKLVPGLQVGRRRGVGALIGVSPLPGFVDD